MAATSSAPFSSSLHRHPLSSPSRFLPADDLESSWILEFVLRQPISNSVSNEIFLSLSFSSPELHPHLSKTLILCRLSSDLRRRSISERTLDSLELIEELDRLLGVRFSNRMKSAYCAAALECTASAYRRGIQYFKDAIKRIWASRILDLMQSDAARRLISVQLVKWRKRMVHCCSSMDENKVLLKKNVEYTLSLVRDYVEEALEEMGQPFLEIAAAEFLEKRLNIGLDLDKARIDATHASVCFGNLDEKVTELEQARVGEKHEGLAGAFTCVMEVDGVQNPSGVFKADTSLNALEGSMARKEPVCLDDSLTKLQDIHHCVAGMIQRTLEMETENNKRSACASEHGKINSSECLVREVESDQVSKVKEALKKSCFDLNMAVEDPLPEAQAVAATVLASLSHDHDILSETVKQNAATNAVSPVPASVNFREGSLENARCNFYRNLPNFKNSVGNGGKKCNKEAGPSKGTSILACSTIFERNSTAHTCEWSDISQESCFENLPDFTDKLQSSSSRTRGPFQPRLDTWKYARRRVLKRWTSLEEATLREAVAKYGKGNWKFILNNYSEIFAERSEIDLKDKWRNMIRHLG